MPVFCPAPAALRVTSERRDETTCANHLEDLEKSPCFKRWFRIIQPLVIYRSSNDFLRDLFSHASLPTIVRYSREINCCTASPTSSTSFKDPPFHNLLFERAMEPFDHPIGFRLSYKSKTALGSLIPKLLQKVVRGMLRTIVNAQIEARCYAFVQRAIYMLDSLRNRF